MIGRQNRDADNHGALGGVLTHENGIHLYKSNEARSVALRQVGDYGFVGFLLMWLGGLNPYTIMPLFVLGLQMPRKVHVMRHFCWHAELLPHTEQVCFHKTTLFGAVQRTYVNIADLEKIDSSQVDAFLMWEINMFDPDLIFRDTASREIFVFDKLGLWNQEALEHPLLY